MHCNLRAAMALSILITWTASVTASATQGLPKKSTLDKMPTAALIDKLKDIAEGNVGYMPTRTGSGFLPLGISEPGALLLFQGPPTSSDILRELVKRGATAAPDLIAHLDDKRTTKIKIDHGGVFGGMFFEDEYDYNSRIGKKPPEGVNRDSPNDRKHPNHHTVTIGDLCFVALGQIVNRHFNAVRYQPTACIMINSPTYSEALLKVVKKEWGGLTPEQHKQSLIRDFTDPDSEYRRNGACLRLGYYYPEALEALALKQLAEPSYDVFELYSLIREKLYRAKTAPERKKIFDDFMAKRNEVTRQGVLLYLFEDLNMQEHDEAGSVSPPFKDGEHYQARACLIELFSYPKSVKSEDQPWLMPLENCTQVRFIEALSNFPTKRIDTAVRELLHSTENLSLASACVTYLVGRGADEEIRRYVQKRLQTADEDQRKALLAFEAMSGWSPLHLAAGRGETTKIDDLILKGAEVNARAADGKTPLHVAAANGSYGSIRLLLERKANPNLKDQEGTTPIQLALGYEAQAAEMLLAAGAEPTDIFVAAFAGRADLVAAFLEKDKNLVKSNPRYGETPLHVAARRNHVKVAELLLANGADVNANEPKNKLTPLHWAAGYGRREIVALLLAHKADRNAKSWDGRTALQHARDDSRDKETIRLLEKE